MKQGARGILWVALFVMLVVFGTLVDEQAAKIVSLSCAWTLAIALMLEFIRVCGGDDDYRH